MRALRAGWARLATVGVVLALAVVVGAASIASASAKKRQTLQLRTTVVSSSLNDAGHGGVADVTAVLFSLQTPGGAAAGQGLVSCVRVTTTDNLCHAAFTLADGQIDAQAEIPMPAPTFTAAITGGTGAFEGAGGHIDNVVVAPGVTDRTFHLLLPHD